MSDTKKVDHWQSLASEIGAEVPPDEGPVGQPASEVKIVRDEGRRPKSDRGSVPARRSRPRANWMDLAEQLGVAASEAQRRSPPKVEAEPVAAEDSAETQVWPSASPEPQEWLLQEPLIDTFEGGSATEVGPASAERRDSRGERGRTEEEEGRPSRKRRKRRRRGRETRTADDRSEQTQTPEGPDVEPIAGAGEASEAEAAPDGERGDSDREKSKRRRRGRGDRRRSASEKPVPAGAAPDDAAAEFSAKDLDQEEDETLSLEDEDDKSSKDAGFAHRGIPSWEEAVGVVIAANMESRSKRGGESSSRPRGGRGRGGRDRGGRERGPKRARPS